MRAPTDASLASWNTTGVCDLDENAQKPAWMGQMEGLELTLHPESLPLAKVN